MEPVPLGRAAAASAASLATVFACSTCRSRPCTVRLPGRSHDGRKRPSPLAKSAAARSASLNTTLAARISFAPFAATTPALAVSTACAADLLATPGIRLPTALTSGAPNFAPSVPVEPTTPILISLINSSRSRSYSGVRSSSGTKLRGRRNRARLSLPSRLLAAAASHSPPRRPSRS